MWVSRTGVSAAIVLVALAVAAGCGGSSGHGASVGSGGSVASGTVAVGAWVGRVCAAFNQFGAANKKVGSSLDGLALEFKYGLPTQTSARAIQVTATAGLAANGEAARRSVAAAGTPSVGHGAQIEAGFVAALVTVRDAVTNVHRQALALPQGSARAPNSALLVGQLRTAFVRFGHDLTHTRDQYDTPALAAAFRAETACG